MHPILLQWGDFQLPAYGFFYLLAFLGGLAVGAYLMSGRTGVPFPKMFDICFMIVVAGEIGARLTFVVVEWERFASGQIGWAQFLVGGRVVLGGILTASIVGTWMVRRHKLPPIACLDGGLVGASLGMGIGRLGCLLAGCCYGKPTDAWWGITFSDPLAEKINATPLGEALHPTQILQSIEGFLLFGFLWWLYRHKRFDGHVAATWLLLSGTGRFVIEFLRGDDRGLFLGLATSQWIGIAMVVVGTVWLARGWTQSADRRRLA